MSGPVFDPDTPSDARPGAPSRPRLAATLVLVHEGADGPEVLMGRRAGAHRFMPGKFVFPGGRVDPGDGRIPIDGALSREDEARLRRRLTGPRARAAACAAIRETYEETGAMLARPGAFDAQPPSAWRPFANAGRRPAVGDLRLIARAITPTRSSIRFDAYFFLARLAERQNVHDSNELSDVAWRPFSACETLELPAVTRFILAQAAAQIARPRAPVFLRTVRGVHRVSEF